MRASNFLFSMYDLNWCKLNSTLHKNSSLKHFPGKFQVIKIHLAMIDNVQRKFVYAFSDFNTRQRIYPVPMMPLPPGNGIPAVVGGNNFQGGCCWPAIQI